MRVCPVCGRPGAASEVRCPHDGASLVVLEGSLEARETDLLGQVVDGRYRVESVIGRGGMGVVFAAQHVVVGRRVALKVLKPSLEHSEDTLSRFVREAQAANAVRSPYILRADDFGQLSSGAFYVVMDLLEGSPLGDALRERRLSHDVLLEVFAQVADGLGAAHAAGIVHRDLKPDNVFLVAPPGGTPAPGSGGPQVRILDFGVAKLMHQSARGLTETGVILGTPYYMSPEQARGLEIDHRADIYALGVVMYQAFTGRLPFIADSAVGVLTAHAVDEPPAPSLSGVDGALEHIILKCMQKRPEQRFQTMSDVSAALRHRRARTSGAQLPPADVTQAHPSASFTVEPTYPSATSSALVGGMPTGMTTAPRPSVHIVPAAPMMPVHAPPTDTATAMSAIAHPAPSRGLYLALGAAIAIVGVLGAMLVVRRDAPAAPGAATSTGNDTHSAGSAEPSPASGARDPAAAASAEPAPTPAASASASPPVDASSSAAAAPPPPPGPPVVAPGPRPAAPPPVAAPAAPPAQKPPPRGEIRSPFD